MKNILKQNIEGKKRGIHEIGPHIEGKIIDMNKHAELFVDKVLGIERKK